MNNLLSLLPRPASSPSSSSVPAFDRSSAQSPGWAQQEVQRISPRAETPPERKTLDTNASHPPVSSPEYVDGTPDWVKPIIEKASDKNDIPTMMLSALLKQESGFDPKAHSKAGGIGIAQFMPDVAQKMGIDPMNPESAIMGAARMLRESWDKFGKPDLALASYNAGGKAVKQFGGVPPYKHTQDYVKNIMAMASEPHQSANGLHLQLLNDMKNKSTKKI